MEEDQARIIVSGSPHILSSDSTKNIMWLVSLCLLPTSIFGIYIFGISAFIVLIATIISAVLTEFIIFKIRKKPVTLDDGSAFLTGLILGLNFPANIPLYIPILSAIFAIALVKQAFGGLANNIANPAMTARVFALFSWSKHMSTYVAPLNWKTSLLSRVNGGQSATVDVITSSTPLSKVKVLISENYGNSFISTDILKAPPFTGPMDMLNANGNPISYLDLFLGMKGGCIGEVSVLLLLVGSLLLIYKKIINVEIPIVFIATVLFFAWCFDGLRYGMGFFAGDPLFHLLTGGLVFGALFCATDLVTTPITFKGRIIFAFGCGFITILVRMFHSLPEGVSISIIFMNIMTPVIDKFIKITPLGVKKQGNK